MGRKPRIALRAALGAYVTSLCLVAIAGRPARADDWPAYGHDNARSRVSSERLSAPAPEPLWTCTPASAPQPCWPEPARHDWYHKGPDTVIKPRVTFDRAFHVAAVDDRVYFGSSADDTVYCLDAATGRERWTFTTEGPVRLAPTVSDGRVYVGSDDGHAYCLSAGDGALVWKRRPSPRDYRVPNDGNLISLWPIRTGVVVDGDVAYCGAGLFPSEEMYLCALDARTGAERWKTARTDLSPQGYMLASVGRLYVPAGRSRPAAFDRAEGRYLGLFGGGGGTYALLTADNVLVYGPGRYTGELAAFDAASQDHFATFDGNHIIVANGMSYLHTDTKLSALDRARYLELTRTGNRLKARRERLEKRLKALGPNTAGEQAETLKKDLRAVGLEIAETTTALAKTIRWRVPCACPYSLILAGDLLLAGGDGKVTGIRAETGETVWTGNVTGRAYGLAAANGRLFVSTDTGAIHCFRTKNGGR